MMIHDLLTRQLLNVINDYDVRTLTAILMLLNFADLAGAIDSFLNLHGYM